MFLKIFEAIFLALLKNVKATLVAITISVLIYLLYLSKKETEEAKKECVDEKKAMTEELKDMRTRLFDAFMLQQIQRENTSANDSIMKKATQQAIKKIQP